ncbi:hypothetical protein [Yaniella halotolerans]|uniref:hypothetical protein n=1 Tax=Yaniella halotolerans TaxID=225453 RepID=UPI0003B4F2F0|nr:hypothetical protein [Yaniella halotolerans]
MLNKWFRTGSAKCSAAKLTGEASVLAGLTAIYDLVRKRSWVLKNYPILGHARCALLKIRAQIQQYFSEHKWDGRPFGYISRQLVHARSRDEDEKGKASFGTFHDVTADGKEWFVHSTNPMDPPKTVPRAHVGDEDLFWELGTACFWARTAAGRFEAKEFADKAAHDAVKAVSPQPRPGQLLGQSPKSGA